MEDSEPSLAPWWGEFTLATDQAGHWTIGPCKLWIHRSENEWRLVEDRSSDPMEARSDYVVPIAPEEWEEITNPDAPTGSLTRFGFQRTNESLTLHPVLGDRPFVVRPEEPIVVGPKERLTMYVSTPIWVRVTFGAGTPLEHDIPVYRPSDTWFGPNTRDGEVCYATRTTGRMRLENLPLRMHRAVTPVLILNQASDTLPIERIQIPVQYLGLFESPGDHFLWTQSIRMHRKEGAEGAEVRIEEGAPKDARRSERITPPREEVKEGLAVSTFRAISSLFGT